MYLKVIREVKFKFFRRNSNSLTSEIMSKKMYRSFFMFRLTDLNDTHVIDFTGELS